jgi:hypothetical protein
VLANLDAVRVLAAPRLPASALQVVRQLLLRRRHSLEERLRALLVVGTPRAHAVGVRAHRERAVGLLQRALVDRRGHPEHGARRVVQREDLEDQEHPGDKHHPPGHASEAELITKHPLLLLQCTCRHHRHRVLQCQQPPGRQEEEEEEEREKEGYCCCCSRAGKPPPSPQTRPVAEAGAAGAAARTCVHALSCTVDSTHLASAAAAACPREGPGGSSSPGSAARPSRRVGW